MILLTSVLQGMCHVGQDDNTVNIAVNSLGGNPWSSSRSAFTYPSVSQGLSSSLSRSVEKASLVELTQMYVWVMW